MPEGDGEGIYIQAKAYELTNPDDVIFARRIKKGSAYNCPADDFLGAAIRRAYKAVPQLIWMNTAEETPEGDFLRDYRIEIPLAELRKLLA